MSLTTQQISEKLAAAGVNVKSLEEMVTTARTYPKAVPVLIEMLTSGELAEDDIEPAVRALTVDEAEGKAGPALLATYAELEPEDTDTHWAIGNALNVVMTDAEVAAVIAIARDASIGDAREMFVIALHRFKHINGVEETLRDLSKDEEVGGYAKTALRKMKEFKPKRK
jgi:hypothetical protein